MSGCGLGGGGAAIIQKRALGIRATQQREASNPMSAPAGGVAAAAERGLSLADPSRPSPTIEGLLQTRTRKAAIGYGGLAPV